MQIHAATGLLSTMYAVHTTVFPTTSPNHAPVLAAADVEVQIHHCASQERCVSWSAFLVKYLFIFIQLQVQTEF